MKAKFRIRHAPSRRPLIASLPFVVERRSFLLWRYVTRVETLQAAELALQSHVRTERLIARGSRVYKVYDQDGKEVS